MKILIAPGAFKNSLSASTVADALARGLKRSGLTAEIHLLPIADGGNGTLEAFLINGGRRITTLARDPLGRPIEADFALLDEGKTAVIEMAAASGLELLKPHELNPLATSTYGTGHLLQEALNAGAKRIIIGVGGSATVDGGAGCMQALGARLIDSNGRDVLRSGGNLDQIRTIDVSRLDARWKEIEVIVASDVDNPLLGEQGATAVFGPQKGANERDVQTLEANLRHFFTLIKEQLGKDVLETPGGGAAGGLAAGLIAFLGGRIQSGVDLILEHNRFEEHLRNAQLVITGEGRMDDQTVRGKGPIGVARRARAQGIPTVAIVGGLNVDDAVLHDAGIQAVLPIVTAPMPLEQAIERSAELVERAALRLGYLLQLKVQS